MAIFHLRCHNNIYVYDEIGITTTSRLCRYNNYINGSKFAITFFFTDMRKLPYDGHEKPDASR